jgi:hypothetical protein
LQANCAALELCVDRSDALPMRVIESFRDAKNGGEAPGKPLIGIAQGAVRRMIVRWLRFPVVITNRRGDEISLAPGQARNIAVQRKVFTVLVMAFVADGVANVVEKRGGFKKHARFGGKMMDRLKLIEKLQAELANVFGVAAIAIEAAGKDARAAQHLARFRVVAMGFFPGKSFASNFAEQSFANSDSRNGKSTEIQVAAEREKNQSRDAHHVGAVTADTVNFHTRVNVTAQEIGQALAQQRKLECRETVFARAGRKVCERFRIPAESNGKFTAEIGARRKL